MTSIANKLLDGFGNYGRLPPKAKISLTTCILHGNQTGDLVHTKYALRPLDYSQLPKTQYILKTFITIKIIW